MPCINRTDGGHVKAENALKLGALSTGLLTLTGCEAVKTIFKAGVWFGVLGVLAVVIGIGFLISRLGR
jgi:hypothetical protein